MHQELKLSGDPGGSNYLELKAKDGRIVYLGPGEQVSIDMIRDLPVADILHLMHITNYQLRCYLADYRQYILAEVIKTIKKSWIYKTDDSSFSWEAHTMPFVTTDFLEFKKQLKKKNCPFTDEQLEDIIDWFVCEESEVKLPLEDSIEMKIARAAAKLNKK